MNAKVSFIGLGVMGFPMAGHLARHGHDICVFNRTPDKADLWVREFGGLAARTPAKAAEGSDFVFLCVGNDDDVREVVLGPDGVLQSMATGSCLIDHTTTSAVLAREIGEAAADRKVQFLDAPVSGGQAGAESGALTIMVGGTGQAFQSAVPRMEAYGKSIKLMGPVGSGQLTKMVNQICIAGLVQGLAEGLNFAQHAGLDGEKVVDVISKGAAQSWQMDNRSHSMLNGEFDFGFAVEWMRKDLGIVLDEASRNGASLPITQIVDGFYADVQAMGGNRWDTSSLIERLRRSPKE